MGLRTFPKITAYPHLKKLQERLLSGESVLKIKTDLDKEQYFISVDYLREYKRWLQDIKNSEQDEILMELERKGILPYVNEVSFLKALVASSFKNLDPAKIDIETGLKAASMLIERELKLPQNQAQKVNALFAQFITEGEPQRVQDVVVEQIEEKTDKE
jgi:hypothetical protein